MPGKNKVSPREHIPSTSSVESQGCKTTCFRRPTPGPKTDVELKDVEQLKSRQRSLSFTGSAVRVKSSKKNSSFTTILSIWNCVMGSSLLTMPWAFEKAGFAQTIVLMMACGLISCYTAVIIIRIAMKLGKEDGELPEFQIVCRQYLGPIGEYAYMMAANTIIFGCLMAYFVLMAKFLFGAGVAIEKLTTMTSNDTVKPFIDDFACVAKNMQRTNVTMSIQGIHVMSESAGDDIKKSFSVYWDLNMNVPLYIIVPLFCLCMIRDPTFFAKFSAFGTVTVGLIFATAFYKAAQWGIQDNANFDDELSPHYVSQYNSAGTVILPGILSMGYFVHTGVTTMLKDNRDQTKNVRDLCISYVLVFITYTVLGLVFYLAYPGWKNCITDEFIENFDRHEWIVPVMNVLMFLRILTVYPLLTYIVRVQNSLLFFNHEWPGYMMIAIKNAIIVAVGCLAAMFYDRIGDIIRYTGTLCAAVLMYFLPCVIRIIDDRQETGHYRWHIVAFHALLIVYGVVNFIIQFTVNVY